MLIRKEICSFQGVTKALQVMTLISLFSDAFNWQISASRTFNFWRSVFEIDSKPEMQSIPEIQARNSKPESVKSWLSREINYQNDCRMSKAFIHRAKRVITSEQQFSKWCSNMLLTCQRTGKNIQIFSSGFLETY